MRWLVLLVIMIVLAVTFSRIAELFLRPLDLLEAFPERAFQFVRKAFEMTLDLGEPLPGLLLNFTKLSAKVLLEFAHALFDLLTQLFDPLMGMIDGLRDLF